MSWEIYLLVVFPNYARTQGGVRLGIKSGGVNHWSTYVFGWARIGETPGESGGVRGGLGAC